MTVPDGRLRARRVVADLGGPLADALDWALTGYLRLESDSLLLDERGATILTVEEGVPVAATHTGGDSVGAEALAEAAAEGLYRLELRELEAAKLPEFHHHDRARVPPTLPANQLVGDSELVARTREAASGTGPGDTVTSEPGLEAVESFLEDAETISSIRDRARSEARERADEWGFEPVDTDDHTTR
jgi:hypothetical protein